nr:MAG TPA: hypothetical protein [Bacteriophage sp.]
MMHKQEKGRKTYAQFPQLCHNLVFRKNCR